MHGFRDEKAHSRAIIDKGGRCAAFRRQISRAESRSTAPSLAVSLPPARRNGVSDTACAAVFMRDRALDRVARFAPVALSQRWHESPARAGHLLVGFLLALTALNMLVLAPIA